MKRNVLIGLTSLVIGLMFVGASAFAQGGYMNRSHGGCWDCGWTGGGRMGMNRMMMGSGNMNHRMMMGYDGCGMMMDAWSGNSMTQGPWQDLRYDAYGRLIEPLNKQQAEEIARYYVEWTGNPNLKVGKIKEKSNVYEVWVVTKDNSLVDKLLIDKETGAVQPETR